MGDDKGYPILFGLGFFLGICVGIFLGYNISGWAWRRDAIKYEYAQYDSKTGDWHWKPKPIEITDVQVLEGPDYSESARKIWNEKHGEK